MGFPGGERLVECCGLFMIWIGPTHSFIRNSLETYYYYYYYYYYY